MAKVKVRVLRSGDYDGRDCVLGDVVEVEDSTLAELSSFGWLEAAPDDAPVTPEPAPEQPAEGDPEEGDLL